MKSSKVNNTAEATCLVGNADPDSRIAMPAWVLAIVTTILLVTFHGAWYWYLITWVLAFAVMGAVSWRAFVELDQGVVRVEARLYGMKLLRRRVVSFKEYVAVVMEHLKTADDDDWKVGLQHCSGRRIWMRRYMGNDPRHPNPEFAASGFAMALSEKMNLPIQDSAPPDLGPWLCRVKLRRSKN